jgi:hypothetical protein
MDASTVEQRQQPGPTPAADDRPFSTGALWHRLRGAARAGGCRLRALCRPRVVLGLTLLLAVGAVTGGARLAPHWPLIAPLARAALTPGTTTARLDALEPTFRDRVERVLERMDEQGFRPRVRTTWRSPDRQELI